MCGDSCGGVVMQCEGESSGIRWNPVSCFVCWCRRMHCGGGGTDFPAAQVRDWSRWCWWHGGGGGFHRLAGELALTCFSGPCHLRYPYPCQARASTLDAKPVLAKPNGPAATV